MKGLEVLERIPIERIPDWILCCLVVGCFSILIPAFIVQRLTKDGRKAFLAEVVSGIIYLVFMIFVLRGSSFLERPTGEYQYKVKITEDAGYIEVTDKYVVISENDDGTYIVQEKTE